HVFDRRLVDHQVGSDITVHLDAAFVIPLDDAVNLLAVTQDNNHRGLGLHLLLIVEIFGVGLLRWRSFASSSASVAVVAFGTLGPALRRGRRGMRWMIVPVEGGANQFTVGKTFGFDCPLGWHGINRIFHNTTY